MLNEKKYQIYVGIDFAYIPEKNSLCLYILEYDITKLNIQAEYIQTKILDNNTVIYSLLRDKKLYSLTNIYNFYYTIFTTVNNINNIQSIIVFIENAYYNKRNLNTFGKLFTVREIIIMLLYNIFSSPVNIVNVNKKYIRNIYTGNIKLNQHELDSYNFIFNKVNKV